MAVEIPVTRRADVMAPIEQQSVNLKAPSADIASAQMKGFGNLVEGGIDSYNQYQKTKLSVYDLKATDKANQFESAMKTRLTEIKQKEGDTTPDYVKFDEDMGKLAEEMLAEDTYDSDYKDILRRKIFTTSSGLRGSRDMQQAAQQYAYRERVVKNSIANDQENILEYGSYLDVTNPDTFAQMNAYRDKIVRTVEGNADQKGTLVLKDDGTPDWDQNGVGLEIKDNVGKAIKPLVKSLNGLGKVEESKAVLEQYKDYMNPSDLLSLEEDTKQSSIKRQALNILHNADYKITFDQIKGMNLGPELTSQLRRELITHHGQTERMNNIVSKQNFNVAYQDLKKIQEGDPNGGYLNFDDYKARNEGYKAIKDTLTPRQEKTLKNTIEGVDDSDPYSYNTLMDAYNDQSVLDMPENQRLDLLSDLNGPDRRAMEKRIRDLTTGKGSEGVITMTKDAHKQLDEALGALTDDKGRSLFNPKGKKVLADALREDTAKTYKQIKQHIADTIQASNGTWNKKDMNEYISTQVQNLQTAKQNDNTFWSRNKKQLSPVNVTPKLNSVSSLYNRKTIPTTGSKPSATQTPTAPTVKLNLATDYDQIQSLFKAANGGRTGTPPELRNFLNQKGL